MKNDCEYRILSSELSERLFLKRTPLSGGIELTNKCNFKCVHCYETMERDSKDDIISTQRLIQIIDELIEMGVVSVFLTGGEAMLRPDFNYIYEYLRKHGVLVAILSNGSSITEEKCRLFQCYMPRMIDISIYGATEKTYEKVTGIAGMYNKVINAFELLKKYDIPFQLKTVVLSQNKDEIDAMRDIALKYEVPFKFFTNIRPYNDGNRAPIKYMLSAYEILELEKNDKYITNYYNTKKEKKIFTELSERQKDQCVYLCRIAKNSFFITYNGILNGCVRSRRNGYDLKKNSFKDGWDCLYHMFVEPKSQNSFACSKCKIINFCDFCPGQFEIETGNPTIAPKAICNLAHMRYKTFGLE